MYNTDMPKRAELPTTKQLFRSTLIALVTAIVLLVAVILPAEYAIDPTGAGKVLGLTKMGEIKEQLAQEAAEDLAKSNKVAIALSVENKPFDVVKTVPVIATPTVTEPVWRDKIMLTLKPGQGAEVKLVMQKDK